MPTPQAPRTAAATAAKIRGGQDTAARKLRAKGWLPIPPEVMEDLHGRPAEYIAAVIAEQWDKGNAVKHQFCRKCIRPCIPAVTLTFRNGAGRLHWCAIHQDDAEQYRPDSDQAATHD